MQMSYLYASDLPFKNFIYSRYLTSFGAVVAVVVKLIVKLSSVFYAFLLLSRINFVITLSKFSIYHASKLGLARAALCK